MVPRSTTGAKAPEKKPVPAAARADKKPVRAGATAKPPAPRT
jgi:hypothetical protein